MEDYTTTRYTTENTNEQTQVKSINKKQEIKNKLIFIPVYGIISLVICALLPLPLKYLGLFSNYSFEWYYNPVMKQWQIPTILGNYGANIYTCFSIGTGMKMTKNFWTNVFNAEEPKLIARKKWDDSYEMSYEKSGTWNIFSLAISYIIGFIFWIPYYIYLIFIYSYVKFKELS